MNKILLQFLLVIFSLGTFASGSVIKTLENTDKFDVESTQHKLDFVVNVNRKIYYADNVGYYNWTGARENCQSNGMKLASITTEREKRALERSYNRNTFTGSYWTSAWNSLEASQFTWDTSNLPGEEVGGLRWLNTMHPDKMCGRYMSLSYSEYTESYILVSDCTVIMRGTLCEIIP